MGAPNAILVAEDSNDDALLLKMMLRKLRLLNPVVSVVDGEETIAYLQGEGLYCDREQYPLPILLLLDLNMPRKSGLDVLAWLQVNPIPRLGLVLLTGTQDLKQIKRACELGAHSFLMKPLHGEDFLNLVHALKDIRVKPADKGIEMELVEMA